MCISVANQHVRSHRSKKFIDSSRSCCSLQERSNPAKWRSAMLLVLLVRCYSRCLAEIFLVNSVHGAIRMDRAVESFDNEHSETSDHRFLDNRNGQPKVRGDTHAERLVLDGLGESGDPGFQDVRGRRTVNGSPPGAVW